MQTQLSLSTINRFVAGDRDGLNDLIGPQKVNYLGEDAIAVRSFLPQASAAWVVDRNEGGRRPMRRLHPPGSSKRLSPRRQSALNLRTFCSAKPEIRPSGTLRFIVSR